MRNKVHRNQKMKNQVKTNILESHYLNKEITNLWEYASPSSAGIEEGCPAGPCVYPAYILLFFFLYFALALSSYHIHACSHPLDSSLYYSHLCFERYQIWRFSVWHVLLCRGTGLLGCCVGRSQVLFRFSLTFYLVDAHSYLLVAR